MELEDYFEEIGEQKIEEIWYLQRYAEGWGSGWQERLDLTIFIYVKFLILNNSELTKETVLIDLNTKPILIENFVVGFLDTVRHTRKNLNASHCRDSLQSLLTH